MARYRANVFLDSTELYISKRFNSLDAASVWINDHHDKYHDITWNIYGDEWDVLYKGNGSCHMPEHL